MNDSVVIAGAGPVGLMLACELGLAGVPVTVVERQPRPGERSFGMAINPAVVELLGQRGLMDRLAGDGIPFGLAHFAHIPLDPGRLDGQHPSNFAVPQARLTARLAERATELGVRIRRGVEVTGLEQDDAGVTVETSAGPIRAGYLVGCDGADSTVRRLAGIEFAGTDLRFRGVTGDVDAPPGDPLYQLLGPHQHDAGFVTVAPSGANTLRVTTGEFDVEPPRHGDPASLTELRAAVARISGAELTVPETAVRWLSWWTAPTRCAEHYRAGRVFLAGDAAHVHFPLGGLSLSTGFEDVANLGWKLAARIDGWAPSDLLDTYHTERYPVGVRACRVTSAQVALLHPMASVAPLRELLGELIRFGDVNEFLVKLVGGLDSRYEMPAGPEHSLVGQRLADVALRARDGETSSARLLRSGRPVLLTFGSYPDLEEVAAEWAERVDSAQVEPCAQVPAAAVLLRPDGRVAWATADGAADSALPVALRTWFGAPRVSVESL